MSKPMAETSLSADIFNYVRYHLRGRRGLIFAAIVLGGPALWVGWPWLVVAGIAPLLLALAPCAVMCALGLCTMKSCSKPKSGSTQTSSSSLPKEDAASLKSESRLALDEKDHNGSVADPSASANLIAKSRVTRPESTGPADANINIEEERNR